MEKQGGMWTDANGEPRPKQGYWRSLGEVIGYIRSDKELVRFVVGWLLMDVLTVGGATLSMGLGLVDHELIVPLIGFWMLYVAVRGLLYRRVVSWLALEAREARRLYEASQ
ncbi:MULTISPECIES: hypothetical protein [unclassified Streptomyces]|uniref:hypothetical protein n=1 Tax=unclassified Streptomyces TaxID=2593676 RepID=UPI002DD8BC4F|nr:MULTISPECIES: hypothetical protein [unclassified Streptomyces]WSS46811.1 hypothetical protein OG220_40315 [Streptomyces sp. NBC_01187]WSA97671.1 hypothetical protein OIE63_39900 [Streptomyces sp. NBC_01795]WSB82078.1 hypothetical protein OHB04_40910 [Streptomyces sp. NBC_01775]WSS18051.1 hypothetical protein OG533_39995 [Streptomyces sp. NBC_01186]WSS46972.1 hypothetical protein OG220_41310 [Streptomyces sp. NBC_01187]